MLLRHPLRVKTHVIRPTRPAPRRLGARLSAAAALLVFTLVFAVASHPAGAAEPRLRVGVGRADITPPVRGYFGGWANEDAVPHGVHTRLFARAVILQSGSQKVALVSADLSYFSDGILVEAIGLLPGRGLSAEHTLVSASHTHGGPNGYMNFSTYNSVLPTQQSVRGESSLEPVPPGFKAQLHSFMVRRLALALRRADEDRSPGAAGWGTTRLLGATAQPLARGSPRRPWGARSARGGLLGAGSARRRAHDRPGGGRAARGQGPSGEAHPGRHLVEFRQPRHRQSLLLGLSRSRPLRRRRTPRRGGDPPGGEGRATAGRGERLRRRSAR